MWEVKSIEIRLVRMHISAFVIIDVVPALHIGLGNPNVASIVGDTEGTLVGVLVGGFVGTLVGVFVGALEEGLVVGNLVVGSCEGLRDGRPVGVLVGAFVGSLLEGFSVGKFVPVGRLGIRGDFFRGFIFSCEN